MSEPSDLVPPRPAPYAPPPGSIEGEYLPPGGPAPRRRRIPGLGPILLGLAVAFTKFKVILAALLGLKWAFVVLKVGGSLLGFVASVWAYSLFYGWPIAFVFVTLILIHELGHVGAMRIFGVPSTLPFFIPFFGAFVRPLAKPASPIHESWIALAGPLVGGLAAYGCFLLGGAAHGGFWIACAYLGFFLNLFNMLPVLPFDGGRVVAVVSPRIWIVGLVGLFAVSLLGGFFNPLLVIIALMSAPQAVKAWRGEVDPRLSEVLVADRIAVTAAYFTVAGLLLAGMLAAHIPANSSALR